MELEAQDTAERDAGLALGRDTDIDYERVEELLDQARKRFQERQFEAALTAAQEASRIAERTTEQLRRASWSYAVLAAQGLLEPCNPEDPETSKARALLDRARDVFFQGQLMDDAFLQDLVRAAEVAHAREAERVRDLLAVTRDSIREAANLGAPIALAEDAWKRGGDDLDRDRLAAARESFVEAGQRAEDARLRRIREVEESIGLVSDHIALARNVGADMQEAEGLHQAARAAVAIGEHGQAGDLLRRAERIAMKGQQRQIERAMQLRRAQVEKAQAIINACEPVLKEAESYDLSATEVRVLLRQAQDVLTKGDYLAGLTFARNAEEAAQRLEAQVADERRRRGIQVPASGTCGVCRSTRVTFQDDGWGRCEDCGNTFRWRGAFISCPGALMATGVRGVLRALVQERLVDVVVTTCGTADHDLTRVWQPYYHGEFEMDDVALHRLGVNRLGNVLIPNASYGIVLEKKIQPMLRDLWDSGVRAPTTSELLWELGRRTESRQSLLWWAWKNRIPVVVPAIFDGAVGYQLWSFWQEHKEFAIDQFRDEADLADLVFKAKETGALMIGGGVSKHHTIWWNQFRGGLDHAVYITTAPEWDGSLSGARVREGISWGKVKETANQVTIEGDASAILPMMIAAALGRPHR